MTCPSHSRAYPAEGRHPSHDHSPSLHCPLAACRNISAERLYGPRTAWKDVGQRLADDNCNQRTGRHEEDGYGPAFE
jgi:hypothetical protein